jgi:hypothetical protein
LVARSRAVFVAIASYPAILDVWLLMPLVWCGVIGAVSACCRSYLAKAQGRVDAVGITERYDV